MNRCGSLDGQEWTPQRQIDYNRSVLDRNQDAEDRRSANSIAFAILFFLAANRTVLPALAAPEKISFSPRPGLRLTYHLAGNVSAKGGNFAGQDLSLDALASGDIEFLIRQTTPERVLAALASPGIQVDVQTPSGPSHFVLKTRRGVFLQTVFDHRGNLEEAKNIEALNTPRVMNFSIVQILRDYFPVLPGRPVSTGGTWDDHKRIVIPFQGMDLVIFLHSRSTLLEVQMTGTGKVAKISAEYSVELGGSKPLGTATGSFRGKGMGSGILNFQVEEGYFSDYRLDYKIDAAFVIADQHKKLLELPFSLSVFASILLTEKSSQPNQ